MNDVTESICISAKSFFDGCQDCNAETAEEHIGMFFLLLKAPGTPPAFL